MNYTTLTPDSPELQSLSPIHGNLAALQQLFPSVVREGKVDFDALRQLLGDDIAKDDELYGLQWHGKARARRNALTPSLGTLRPCKAESKNWDSTQNLYIEGDNLEVLKLLQKSYAGKVKMIYIDPPYNTGKEFVYPDNYQNGIEHYLKLTGQTDSFKANAETGGRYHTDWLNMMYPRLMLARELLSDDGVIFISIDKNEVTSLTLLANLVFLEENQLGIISVINNLKGRSDDNFFATCNEFMLVYSKNKQVANIGGFKLSEEEEDSDYKLQDFISKFKPIGLRKTGNSWQREERPYMFYPILFKNGDFTTIPDKDFNLIYNAEVGQFDDKYVKELTKRLEAEEYEVFWPTDSNGRWGRWRWGRETFHEQKGTELCFNESRTLCSKMRATFEDGSIRHKSAKTLWYKQQYDTGSSGTHLKKTMGLDVELFNNPKSVHFLHDILEISTHSDALILDFFSGSATTAHAVMQLNAEDGGNRRFIMVQLPEACVEGSEAAKAGFKNICEIGKERIRRAGEKVKEEAGEKAEGLDIGFRVFKLDSSNVKPWNTEAGMLNMQLEQESNLRPERSSEDIFYEVLLKQGIELTEDCHTREVAGHTVYSLGYGQYYCCFDERIGDEAQELAAGIALWHAEEDPDGQSCVVYVRDSAFDSADIMHGTQGDESDARKKSFCLTLEQSNIMQVKAI